MLRSMQRGMSGEFLMSEPSTPPLSLRSSSQRRNADDVSPSELSPGLLDLHSFDTELLPEVCMKFAWLCFWIGGTRSRFLFVELGSEKSGTDACWFLDFSLQYVKFIQFSFCLFLKLDNQVLLANRLAVFLGKILFVRFCGLVR